NELRESKDEIQAGCQLKQGALCEGYWNIVQHAMESQLHAKIDELRTIAAAIAQRDGIDIDGHFTMDGCQPSAHPDGFHILANVLQDSVASAERGGTKAFGHAEHLFDIGAQPKNNLRRFRPDSRHSGNIVGVIAVQREHVRNLRWAHSELLPHAVFIEPDIFGEIVNMDLLTYQLDRKSTRLNS